MTIAATTAFSTVQEAVRSYATYGGTPSAFARSIFPPQSFADRNAMIRIHGDNARAVQDVYKDQEELRFQCLGDIGSLLTIGDAVSPRWDNIDIPGRSESYMSYAGSDNRKITFNAMFVSSVQETDQGEADYPIRCGRWLQSLTMPIRDSTGLIYPPALCYLVLGAMVANRGVFTQCNITHEGPFLPSKGLDFQYPMIVRADLEFTIVNRRALDASSYLPTPGFPVLPVASS